MKCVSTDTISDRPIRHGEVLHACAVSGANIVRDAARPSPMSSVAR